MKVQISPMYPRAKAPIIWQNCKLKFYLVSTCTMFLFCSLEYVELVLFLQTSSNIIRGGKKKWIQISDEVSWSCERSGTKPDNYSWVRETTTGGYYVTKLKGTWLYEVTENHISIRELRRTPGTGRSELSSPELPGHRESCPTPHITILQKPLTLKVRSLCLFT